MKNKRESDKLKNIIINEYLNTPEKQRSLTQLQRKYGVRRQTIAEWLKDRGYVVVNQQNRLRVDEHVFDVIDTEEKAYWLGFMYADGNISSERHRLEMNLSITDIDHMEKFRKFLKLETEIRVDNQSDTGRFKCRLSVRNKNLWQQLNDKGCVPAKSLILTFPKEEFFANKNLIYDFIRGYCDGDGSLGLYTTRDGKTKTEISFVGTFEFLNGLQSFLEISGYIRNKSSNNWKNKAYDLKYSGAKARQVARLLYENSNVYMDRKYKIYENFCRFEEESSSRTKSSKISRRWDANTEVTSEIAQGSEAPQRVEGE